MLPAALAPFSIIALGNNSHGHRIVYLAKENDKADILFHVYLTFSVYDTHVSVHILKSDIIYYSTVTLAFVVLHETVQLYSSCHFLQEI